MAGFAQRHTEYVRLAELPGLLDTLLRGRISSEHLVDGSVTIRHVHVSQLSDLSADIGSVLHGTVAFGEEGTNITITDSPRPQLRANAHGVTVFLLDVQDDSIVLSIGERRADGTYPIMVSVADDPEITAQTRIDPGCIEMSDIARTIITSGQIDLLPGNEPYEDSNSGIRLKQGHGIESKQDGTRNVFWDASTGELRVGADGEVVLNRWGIVVDIAARPYRGIFWSSDAANYQAPEVNPPLNVISYDVCWEIPSYGYVQRDSYVVGTGPQSPDKSVAVYTLAAHAPYFGEYRTAKIVLTSGANWTSGWEETPGIYADPGPLGWMAINGDVSVGNILTPRTVSARFCQLGVPRSSPIAELSKEGTFLFAEEGDAARLYVVIGDYAYIFETTDRISLV